MATQRTAPAGHRTEPHTADLRVRAWGPTRTACLAQALDGVCSSFLDLRGAAAVRHREITLRGDSDADLLVALLEEVLYWLDTESEIPVGVAFTGTGGTGGREAPDDPHPAGGALTAVLPMADIGTCPVTGAAPKAVTLHGLRMGRDPDGGWSCAVTLDV